MTNTVYSGIIFGGCNYVYQISPFLNTVMKGAYDFPLICFHTNNKPDVNFTNILWEDFKPEDPKSVNIQSSRLYLFALLGSDSINAAHKMLIKLTPGVSQTFYEQLFRLKIPKGQKRHWRLDRLFFLLLGSGPNLIKLLGAYLGA